MTSYRDQPEQEEGVVFRGVIEMSLLDGTKDKIHVATRVYGRKSKARALLTTRYGKDPVGRETYRGTITDAYVEKSVGWERLT